MDDEHLLSIVRAERTRSLGFDLDPELNEEREMALNYSKGRMPDMRSAPNRSKAVSTDIADTIETILPDLVEIFTGGDDVVAFIPTRADDEEAAKQETDFISHAVFQDNDGFMTFYTFFKDALQVKTGVVKYWWEDPPAVEPETFEGKTAMEVMLASQDGEIADLTFSSVQPDDPNDQDKLFDFKLLKEGPDGKVRIKAWPPEDFTVARDTVNIQETTYCAARSRVRAQTLIADGHDLAKIDTLPPYGMAKNEQVQLARDTAGENLFPVGNEGPDKNMRVVEVVEHFVRVLEGNKIVLWRVFTGAHETVLIDKEEVDRIPFEAITPFVVTHRFYGESVADKLAEIQRIKTSLTRGMLDAMYFAQNQRHYVDMTQTNNFTISDILDNRPGVPIRGKGPNAVTAIAPAESGVDYPSALEYISTVAEQRTGIVRNAQGLNPDTLHDTASGQAALMGMAQRRVRLIARIFAEMGMKGIFLGVHALYRKHSTKAAILKLRGKWVETDPTQWAERNDMTIEIGVGAGGAAQKLQALTQVIAVQEKIAGAADPAVKALVSPQNAYRALTDGAMAAGLKQPQEYFTDPSTTAPQPQQPHPEAIKAQQQMASDQAKNQIDQQKLALDGQRLQSDNQNAEADRQHAVALAQFKAQSEQAKLQADQQRQLAQIEADARIKQAELALKAQEAADKAQFERLKLETDARIKIEEIKSRSGTAITVAGINAGSAEAVQASQSQDAHLMAAGDRAHEVGMAVTGHVLSEAAKATDPKPEATP